jgi:hypothetical protein
LIRGAAARTKESFDTGARQCHLLEQVQQGKEVIQCLTSWWRVGFRRTRPWSRPPGSGDGAEVEQSPRIPRKATLRAVSSAASLDAALLLASQAIGRAGPATGSRNRRRNNRDAAGVVAAPRCGAAGPPSQVALADFGSRSRALRTARVRSRKTTAIRSDAGSHAAWQSAVPPPTCGHGLPPVVATTRTYRQLDS